MSSSKENSTRSIFHSKQRRSLKNVYESTDLYSITQTLFPLKKNSLVPSQIQNLQLAKTQFYKTVGNSNNCDGWVRPQSKQASRNVSSRPQTSKGFRKQPTRTILFTNIQNDHTIDTKMKATINSKRLSKKTAKQQPIKQHGLLYNNWQKYKSKEPEICHKQNDQIQDIQIVINRRAMGNGRKGPSVHKNKFQTDLDDQFLQLFAD